MGIYSILSFSLMKSNIEVNVYNLKCSYGQGGEVTHADTYCLL